MKLKTLFYRHCLLFGFFLSIATASHSQKIFRNLDFEYFDVYGTPISWRPQFEGDGPKINWSNIAYSGAESIVIENYLDSSKAGLLNTIIFSRDFVGKKEITIKGYIRTENFRGTAASLWMEMKGGARYSGISSDKNVLQGTNDWKQYSITLPIDADAKAIAFGCRMKGTGRVWFDKFEVFLDGKPLE